jgi:hypothetical protein
VLVMSIWLEDPDKAEVVRVCSHMEQTLVEKGEKNKKETVILKGLSHQFEASQKWCIWKSKNWRRTPLSYLKIFHSFFDF